MSYVKVLYRIENAIIVIIVLIFLRLNCLL